MEIPQSEIVSELHGKSLFPMHKSVDEIAPSSFTEQMKKDNFEAASGTKLTKLPPTKAFVKPNEALGKIKPRLIQHTGPQGTAASALMKDSRADDLPVTLFCPAQYQGHRQHWCL